VILVCPIRSLFITVSSFLLSWSRTFAFCYKMAYLLWGYRVVHMNLFNLIFICCVYYRFFFALLLKYIKLSGVILVTVVFVKVFSQFVWYLFWVVYKFIVFLSYKFILLFLMRPLRDLILFQISLLSTSSLMLLVHFPHNNFLLLFIKYFDLALSFLKFLNSFWFLVFFCNFLVLHFF